MIQHKRDYFDSINKDKISELTKQAEEVLFSRKEKHFRVWRKDADKPHEPMRAIKKGNVMVPLEHYSTNMVGGYLGGKSPVYSFSKGQEDFESTISDIRIYNDDATHFATINMDYLVYGAAYEYIYESIDNKIEYKRVNPLNAVMVYDYSLDPQRIALVRVLMEDNDSLLLEITTKNYRRRYNDKGDLMPFWDYQDGQEREITEKQLFWGDLPAISYEHPKDISLSEPGWEIVNMIENMLTNEKNMTQYNDNAKLIIKGHTTVHQAEMVDTNGNTVVNPEWTAEIQRLYQAPALHFPVEGDASWLIKNVDYGGVLNTTTDLWDKYFILVSAPNVADDKFAGNVSGIAMKYKMYALDQLIVTFDRITRRGHHQRWKLITDRLNELGNNFNILDMHIDFAKNAPMSSADDINEAVQLYRNNLISQNSAIAHANIGLDPTEEQERIRIEVLETMQMQMSESERDASDAN